MSLQKSYAHPSFIALITHCFSSSRSCMHGHRKAAPRMQRVVRPASRLAGDLDPFHPPGKCCQHNFCLHAGDGLPDTTVNAHAEPDVARCIASDVEAVSVGPPPGVAVGGPEKQQHLLPSRDAYPDDLDLARCCAKESLH